MAEAPKPDPEPAATPPAESDSRPRYQDYLVAKARTRAWLDGLEIDCADLQRNGVKGKKKLAEILEAYWLLFSRSKDPDERAAIVGRVKELTAQTQVDAYHDMSQREFLDGIMAYFHVASLMHDFGLDNSLYLHQIKRVKGRLDRNLGQQQNSKEYRERWGVWPLVRFAQFYDRFDLDKPPALRAANLEPGVIRTKYPLERYDLKKIYELTHEILVAFDWGRARTQNLFDGDDLIYARETMSALIAATRRAGEHDLVGSLVSDMGYFGWQDDPQCRAGLDFLLDSQNENGTWADYEKHRPTWGRYLDAHAYLHTTLVALRALTAAYDGDWPEHSAAACGATPTARSRP